MFNGLLGRSFERADSGLVAQSGKVKAAKCGRRSLRSVWLDLHVILSVESGR